MALFPHSDGKYWQFDNSGYPIVGGAPENLMEDFEDGDLAEYGGALSDFAVQSESVLRGKFSLQAETSYGAIGDDGGDFSTRRRSVAREYVTRVMLTGSDAEAQFLVCVQSESDPKNECYQLVLDAEDNDLILYRQYDAGYGGLAVADVQIDAYTEYRAFITMTSDGINAGLRDAEGNELVRTDSSEDTTYTRGGIGFSGGSSAPVIFDHVVQQPGSMEGMPVDHIDGFEDGDLDEYYGPDTPGIEAVEPSASLYGDYGLVLDGETVIYSLPGHGLDNYILDNTEFEGFLNFQSLSAEEYGILVCPDDDRGNPERYAYEVEFKMDGRMRIQKRHGDDEWTLQGHGTGNSDYATTSAPTFEQDKWYWVTIRVDRNDSNIYVKLYDYLTGDIIATVKQEEDTEYMEDKNGIGFYSSADGMLFADEFRYT